MRKRVFTVLVVLIIILSFAIMSNASPNNGRASGKNAVFFIHPDGTDQSHYTLMRLIHYGADGESNWDKLPNVAIYKSHMADSVTGTSHGGATTHATGIKWPWNTFGAPGKTIVHEAMDAGYAVALIQSGHIAEPGTAAFVAYSPGGRGEAAEIAKKVIESGVPIIMAGGERWLIPNTKRAFHPDRKGNNYEPMGSRTDGLDLIEYARSQGYTVVYTREQLMNINPRRVNKLLGVFAYDHTFFDISERRLHAINLVDPNGRPILYEPNAPTVKEMLEVSIKILKRIGKRGFFVVLEEEGTDNFPNGGMNAEGTIEAAKRADDAIGLAFDYAKRNPNTFILTAADSTAGAVQIYDPYVYQPSMIEVVNEVEYLRDLVIDPCSAVRTDRREPLVDGITDFSLWHPNTNNTHFRERPFISRDNYKFFVMWNACGGPDFGGGTIVRAYGSGRMGPIAEDVKGTIDNTMIYHYLKRALHIE